MSEEDKKVEDPKETPTDPKPDDEKMNDDLQTLLGKVRTVTEKKPESELEMLKERSIQQDYHIANLNKTMGNLTNILGDLRGEIRGSKKRARKDEDVYFDDDDSDHKGNALTLEDIDKWYHDTRRREVEITRAAQNKVAEEINSVASDPDFQLVEEEFTEIMTNPTTQGQIMAGQISVRDVYNHVVRTKQKGYILELAGALEKAGIKPTINPAEGLHGKDKTPPSQTDDSQAFEEYSEAQKLARKGNLEGIEQMLLARVKAGKL